jgi:O-acetyl-ADP-ribose deacetylase (regulator of RNase III)
MQVDNDKFFTLCADAVLQGVKLFIGSGSVLELHRKNVQSIVNCANDRLDHAGGIAAEIAYQAGSELTDECNFFIKKFGKLQKKQALVTTAGNMKFEKVIHVAGPVVSFLTSDQIEELIECVFNVIKAAGENGLDSVGIPGISCGIFGFPKKEAAFCHIKGFIKYCKKFPESSVKRVYFALFSPEELENFVEQFRVFMENDEFDYARFVGVPKNRVNCFTLACRGCSSILPFRDFSINRCHQKYCNFCIYRYQLGTCLFCKKLQIADFNYPYNEINPLFFDKSLMACRSCQAVKPLTSKACQSCKNICELHFKSESWPCDYCSKIRK